MKDMFLAGSEFITIPVTIFCFNFIFTVVTFLYGSVPLCLILRAQCFLNMKRKGKLGPKEFVI